MLPSWPFNTSSRLGLALSIATAGYLLARSIARRRQRFFIDGKVVLITGASRGLGLVLARHLAQRQCKLVLCARSQADLDDAARQLKKYGNEVLTVAADLNEQSGAKHVVQETIDRFGHLDVLINNAGIIQVGPQASLSIDDYEKAMQTNFWAALYMMLEVIPQFKNTGSGRIVNITSIGGKIPFPHLLPYVASKFALVGLSEGLYAELKKENITVTTVVPGLMRTGSPRNIWVKGKHELEYAWFKIADSLPLLSQSAETAAAEIISACEQGKAVATLSRIARLGVLFHTIAPEALANLLSVVNRILPANGVGGEVAKRGHESESVLSRGWLGQQSTQAAMRNNEFQN